MTPPALRSTSPFRGGEKRRANLPEAPLKGELSAKLTEGFYDVEKISVWACSFCLRYWKRALHSDFQLLYLAEISFQMLIILPKSLNYLLNRSQVNFKFIQSVLFSLLESIFQLVLCSHPTLEVYNYDLS